MVKQRKKRENHQRPSRPETGLGEGKNRKRNWKLNWKAALHRSVYCVNLSRHHQPLKTREKSLKEQTEAPSEHGCVASNSYKRHHIGSRDQDVQYLLQMESEK